MELVDYVADFVTRTATRARQSSIHYECRRCGTTLSYARSTCPTCGSGEIATIPL